jgi:hypothetical protein
MTQACRFAFFQASCKRNHWTGKQTEVYLKQCGVAPEVAKSLFKIARQVCKDGKEQSIDYWVAEAICVDAIVKFKFPAAWLNKKDGLALMDYIEAVMHMLALGICESNFELANDWLKGLDSKAAKAAKLNSSSFRNGVQPLLQDLKKFMLSWLQVYPFGGEKKKTTGAWVGENWLAFARISKFVYGRCCARQLDLVSKHGVNDVSRMVISFHALVARFLTHSGISDGLMQEVQLLVKEFMSCVRELDIRVNHESLGKTGKEKKKGEAWWLKSNYMSLPNLVSMMDAIGPLVLFWDGGGKGEKFIQSVKPHIKRGVRGDAPGFFVRLLEKLYKIRAMEELEKRYNAKVAEVADASESDEIGDTMEMLNELVDNLLIEEEEEQSHTNATLHSESDSELEEEEEEESNNSSNGKFIINQMEETGMAKTRTIYVYRTEAQVEEAMATGTPIAGTIEIAEDPSGEKAFEFKMIFRMPGKTFGKRRVTFDDANGVNFHGMWCAEALLLPNDSDVTKEFSDIQSSAKMSAVAIPLSHTFGHGHQHSKKYYVFTNWWKERTANGEYELPSLSLSSNLYSSPYNDQDLAAAAAAPANGQSKANTIPVGQI